MSNVYTAISGKVVGKSARHNLERYCGWFWVHCSSKKFERTDVCLRLPKESNKSRFDSYNVRNSVACTFFSDHLSRNSCMYITNIFCHFIRLWIKCLYNHLCKGHWRVEIPPPGGIQGKFITLTQNAFSVPSFSGLVEIETGIFAQSQYRATCSNSPLVWVVQNVKRKQRWQKRSEEEKSKAWNLSYHHIVRYPLMARRRYCLLVLELTRGKYALDTSNFTRKKHVDWAMPDLVTALTGHCFESNFSLCADSTFHSIETFHSRTRTFAYFRKINRRQNDAALRARLA